MADSSVQPNPTDIVVIVSEPASDKVPGPFNIFSIPKDRTTFPSEYLEIWKYVTIATGEMYGAHPGIPASTGYVRTPPHRDTYPMIMKSSK